MNSTPLSPIQGGTVPKQVILVVEDDADIREIVCELLQDAGYAVMSAAHGREALELLASGRLPRLILLDLMMPVLDGLGFVAEQRKLDAAAAIPVVFFSASGHVPSVDAACVLKKPASPERLLEVIERFCGPPVSASASPAG